MATERITSASEVREIWNRPDAREEELAFKSRWLPELKTRRLALIDWLAEGRTKSERGRDAEGNEIYVDVGRYFLRITNYYIYKCTAQLNHE
ncbi:MAG: hypothetical protein NUV80_04275 [Candidatus Berkelbacteria bacterium]|nr:hypothetical protein [Candidatus Berkelbacteria bacterium]